MGVFAGETHSRWSHSAFHPTFRGNFARCRRSKASSVTSACRSEEFSNRELGCKSTGGKSGPRLPLETNFQRPSRWKRFLVVTNGTWSDLKSPAATGLEGAANRGGRSAWLGSEDMKLVTSSLHLDWTIYPFAPPDIVRWVVPSCQLTPKLASSPLSYDCWETSCL